MANGTENLEQAKLFQLFKPTQGYWTRMSTAIGAGALSLWGASWLFDKFSPYRDTPHGLYIQVGAALLFILVFGGLLFWLVGKNQTAVNFLISVEGEMKKVNWSTWPEVVGATKVVILFTILMALMLVIVDTFFMSIFSAIGVLKGPGIGSLLHDTIDFFGKLFRK